MTGPTVWILGGVRTPFAKAGTAFRRTPVYELGRVAVSELLARQELDPAQLDEVILGNCAQPPEAANVARVTALRAGIPERVPGVTVHRNCASGMEAVAVAAERIQLGRARVVLAGGMESMSQIPLLFPFEFGEWLEALSRAKDPLARLGAAARFRPAMLRPRLALMEALTDPVCGLNMGETAEVLAREFRIRRGRQDEFALASHQRTIAARERLREEIVTFFPATRLRDGARRRGPARTADAGAAREAQAVLRPPQRHHHRRELLPGHGWCGGPARGRRGNRAWLARAAARPAAGLGLRRPLAAPYGARARLRHGPRAR